MEELTQSRISILIHLGAALFMGWLSILIGNIYGDLVAIVIGIGVLITVGFGTEKVLKKKGMAWWFGNGIIFYLFFWLIAWIIFFNL